MLYFKIQAYKGNQTGLCFGEQENDEMKAGMKKTGISALVIILIILGILLWYKTPVGVLNINPQEVSEIRIFDGRTGKGTEIVEEAAVDYFVNHLNTLRMKRRGWSLGNMGYGFRVTIDTKNGKQTTFIVNSATDVRRDPFFYDIEEGEIDYAFITALFKE